MKAVGVVSGSENPLKTKLKGFPFVLQRSVIFLLLRLVAFVIVC